jgi:hypothetical protein
MEITKVYYERIFPLAPYINEKVGFEATIDGTVESEKEALTKLKQISEEWHIANNPQVHSDPNTFTDYSVIPSIQIKPEDREIGITAETLLSCNDIPTIDSYRLLIRDNQLLQKIYDKRREEIKQAEIADIMHRTNELTKK